MSTIDDAAYVSVGQIRPGMTIELDPGQVFVMEGDLLVTFAQFVTTYKPNRNERKNASKEDCAIGGPEEFDDGTFMQVTVYAIKTCSGVFHDGHELVEIIHWEEDPNLNSHSRETALKLGYRPLLVLIEPGEEILVV